MTETELRSKSDQEINLLAAEVMGWPIQNHPQPEIPLPKIINEREQLTLLSEGPGGHPVISFWNPIDDACEAINLAEHVANLSNHGYLSTGRARKIWSVVFAGYLVEDEVFAKALTIASLLAYDSLKGEVGE